MIMGVKYQLVCCKYPEEILQITYTHMNELIALISDDSEASHIRKIQELVKKVIYLRI